MKICIDPGHGGIDPGAVGNDPMVLTEKEVNLSVSLFLRDILEGKGHAVVMTRKMDRSLSLGGRSRFANRTGAELFVSVHCNSAANSSASGIETWIYPESVDGRFYAEKVQGGLVAAFPDHRDRGVKSANYHVLRETEMPAILVECEFLSNPVQLQFLAEESNRLQIAAAIGQAI